MQIESPVQIEHDGALLFATTLGTGPDVILLHPTPVHHAFWLPVAELLAGRYRLTLVDLRGHGRSSAGTGAITMQKLAEDTHAVLRAMQIPHAAFIGCSIGSYTLYEYWRRFPQEVAALVFACGKPQPDSAANREARRESDHAARKPGGLAKFFDRMADTLIGPTAQQHHPQVRAAARDMMDAVSLDAMLAVQQGLMDRPDSVPTLKTIHVPVCAIAAAEDHGTAPAEMRMIAQQAPDAEFHLIEDAGHYAPFEQPLKLAAIIGDFLDRRYKSHPIVSATRKAH